MVICYRKELGEEKDSFEGSRRTQPRETALQGSDDHNDWDRREVQGIQIQPSRSTESSARTHAFRWDILSKHGHSRTEKDPFLVFSKLVRDLLACAEARREKPWSFHGFVAVVVHFEASKNREYQSDSILPWRELQRR